MPAGPFGVFAMDSISFAKGEQRVGLFGHAAFDRMRESLHLTAPDVYRLPDAPALHRCAWVKAPTFDRLQV